MGNPLARIQDISRLKRGGSKRDGLAVEDVEKELVFKIFWRPRY